MKKLHPSLNDCVSKLFSFNFRNRFVSLIFVIFVQLLFVGSSFTQTGPGGIGSSANNIIWLDAWELNQANGTPVSNWADQSGNGNNYTQATSSRQPIHIANGFNSLPFVDFDGIDDALASGSLSDLTNVQHVEIFSVIKSDNVSQNETIFSTEYQGTTTDKVFYGQYTFGSSYNSFGRNLGSSTAIINSPFGNPSSHNILHTEFNITTNALRSLLNGSLVSTNSATRNPGNNLNSTLGTSYLNLYYFEGQIGEFIIFTSDLNSLEERIVVNSLAAKYNISVPFDHYAYQATHNLNVIGIGNTAGLSHTASQGKDVVGISSPSDLNPNEFMFIGHNDVDLNSFSFNVPPSMIGGARFSRLWRVDKTGDLGTVTVVFDLDPISDFSMNPLNYRLFINNTSDFSSPSSSLIGTYNAGSNSVTFTNVSFNAGDFFTLAGDAPVDIYSISSGDWSNPNTWDCNCIPTQLNSVTINPTHVVEVDLNSECLNLTVEALASLTMNSGSNLDIYGDLSLMGAFTPANGQLSLVGSIAQSFDAGGNTLNLNDLLIANVDPAGATIEAGQYLLNGTLTMETGLMTIAATGTSFTVNSTTSGTEGRIAAIPLGASISGLVSVRRFIPSGLANWRDVCSPVTGATFAQWDPDLQMSGNNFPDGCASSGTDPCYESVRFTLNGVLNGVLNVTDPIVNGRGYSVFMGDDLNTFSGTTLTSTGTVNGSSNIVKVYGSGVQTVGNPYVSPMLFSLTTRNSQIGNYFYVYDASIGDYQWYDGTSATSSIPELSNGLMATGQSIWIFTTSAGGTITFHQTDKTSANATYMRSQEVVAEDNNLYLKLRELNTTYESSITLSESDKAEDGVDSLMDMQFLVNGHETASRLSIVTGDASLKKNFIRNDGRNKAFNLNTHIKRAGYYSLELSNYGAFDSYGHIVLYDVKTNEFIDLKKEVTYTFYSDIFEGSRFTLILTNEEASEESTVQSLTINETGVQEDNQMTITQMGNAFNVELTENMTEDSQVKLVNVLGQTEVYSINMRFVEGSNMITVPADLKGVHVLIITTGGKMVNKKVVL